MGEKVNYGEYEVEEVSSPGDTGKGEIVDIKIGKAKDFFDQPRSDPEADTIQLIVKTPDGYNTKVTGKLSMHPMAKFRRITDTIGHKPQIGDQIPVKFDGQFWRVDV